MVDTMPSGALVQGFAGKLELLDRYCRGRSVLHLGAVGETCNDTELRVQRAVDSVHARLSEMAAVCVGVDNDAPSVTALTERGVFDNLVLADVTRMTRADVPMESIDVIVVGDIIEHLAEPGRLLDVIGALGEEHTRVILTTPNCLGLGIFLRNLRGRRVEGPDHVCSFNSFTLSNLLTRCGWRIEATWTCHQPRAEQLHGRGFQLGRLVLRRLPRLGGTLFMVASRDRTR